MEKSKEVRNISLVDFLMAVEENYKSSISSYVRIELYTHGGGRLVARQMDKEFVLQEWTPGDFEEIVDSLLNGILGKKQEDLRSKLKEIKGVEDKFDRMYVLSLKSQNVFGYLEK